ncbi:MAG: glycoside hydrolase family 3 C-terminal domain-containing protein, partial [Bifidobacteriaceae bacterium]|nr:glycoside hydrolase family 3 C-terminal domain-containing protein [Bifidobacteriaceae bacterium]
YGEDPYLMGEIGKEFVSGLQTGDPTYTKVVSTPKHFFANNAENYRRNGDSIMSERELREYYTPAFAALTGADGSASRSMMSAYNRTNGTPMSASSEYIEQMARRTWGFDGFITSDCDAILDEHVRHQWEPEGLGHSVTGAEATAWSVKAGTDLACDNGNWSFQYVGNLPDARDQGLITEADMDVSLLRVFTERMRLGEWDDAAKVPYRGSDYRPSNQVGKNSAAHTATANKMSDEAPVLLKNGPVAGTNKTALPLDPADAGNIVLLGYLADEAILGGYSGSPNPAPLSALAGLREAVASYGYNPDTAVTQIDGIVPQYGAKPGIESVTFYDAAGTQTLLTAPPGEHRDGVWDWAGWRGIRYDPHYSNPSAMMANQDWGGMFSLDITLPAGTAQVSVQQLSCTGYTRANPGDDETPGTCNGDNASPDPAQPGFVRTGGELVVHLGNETGTIVGRVPADGNASSAIKVALDSSVPTGTPIKLVFVYEPPAYTVSLNPAQIDAVQNADAVVVRVGTRQGESAEEMDRYSIDLPRDQADLVKLARQLNPNTVVWIEAVGQMNIEPFRGEWTTDAPAPDADDWTCGITGAPACSVPGIIWANYNGQAQGQAFARILFGKANPSGKLTFTWYSNILDIGHVNDYNLLPTATTQGRTYWYTNAAVSYPFGWGLSYSTFDYSNITIADTSLTGDETLAVSVDVTNTSAVVGKEVIQLYTTAPGSDGIDRPKRQLKGFEKVALGPGQTKTVTVSVPVADLWFWDDEADAKTWDLGTWTVRIGGSSTQGLSGSFTVTAPPTPSLGQVTTIPDGVVLNTATPGNVINAGLSAAKSDDSFFDLADLDVTYTSSDPTVASVDASGVVKAVGAGWANITATVKHAGQTGSDSFPVIVYAGALTQEFSGVETTLYDKLIAFGSRKATVAEASRGIALGATTVPASSTVAYSYRIAPMDVNTADATVTANGTLTASSAGQVKVTVTAADGTWLDSRSALIEIREHVADGGALTTKVAAVEAAAKPAGTYTDASAAALSKAVAAAKAVLADRGATQAQVNAALAALNAAQAGLVERGDVAGLGALADAAEALASSPGTSAEAAATLRAAAGTARSLVANPGGASKPAVAAALAALNSALSGVTPAAPAGATTPALKSALTALVTDLAALTGSAYTPESFAELTAALTQARAVVANTGATEAQVQAAITAVSKAAASLAPAAPPSAAVVKVKAAQKTLTLVKGKSIKIAAVGYTAAGTSKVAWSSSNTQVASVTATGKVTAKKAGKATLTVTTGNKSAKVSVRVVAKKPAKATVTSVSASVPSTLKVGASAYVTGAYKPATATSVKVTYTSSAPTVVAVDAAGGLVAKAAGTAKITVKAGGKSKAYTVKVS